MNSLISIIIPTYNSERYISETIQSVVNQTYSNWELIIIDDGSTDSTAQIIQKHFSDPKIRYVYQANQGVSIARNNGMFLSKGDYVAFLDSDDLWEPNNLELKIKFLNSEPDIDWVFSDMKELDEKTKEIRIAARGTDENILEKILLWEGEVVPCSPSNVIMRRKCFEEGIKFDPNFSTAADQDFTIQLAVKHEGKRIKEELLTYRVRNDSMCRNIALMEKDHIAVYKKAGQSKLFKSYWFKKKCFSSLYLILAGSWWKNGNNKKRGVFFLLKSVYLYPLTIFKIAIKLLKK